MTIVTRPLDTAAAHKLSTITSWAAEELDARIAAKALSAKVGYSNLSCSRYLDVCNGDDEVCVRISDHEAKSYNRTGDFNIALAHGRNRDDTAHEIVRLTALYMSETMTPIAWDDDGEVEEWGDTVYSLTDNPDAEGAEFEGWQVDVEALVAAIDRAEAFVIGRLDA